MRNLTILVLIVAALYSGYWFVGSSAAEKGVSAAVAELQSKGWTADVGEAKTRGFPSRFDTTLTDVRLKNPDGSIGWTGPFVQSLALSYKPNEVIIAFPDAHQIHLDGTDIALETDGLRASAGVLARPSAPISHLTAELQSGTATFSANAVLSLGKSLVALRSTEVETAYDTYIDLTDIELPAALMRVLEAASDLSPRISQATLDAEVTLDRPLDRHLSNGQPPVLNALDLKGLTVQWGDVSLRGRGAVDVDPSGFPSGQVTLTLRNWDALIDAAVVLGFLPAKMERTVKTLAKTMAAGSDTLDMPISFQNGNMSLGLIPLGPAPRLR